MCSSDYFKSPTDVKLIEELDDKKIRVGGMVKKDSIKISNNEVNFVITDFKSEINVTYLGVIPNLFSEEKGVVAEDRDFNGVNYLNCGDWVESCTALAENYDGSFEILYWDKIREQYLDDKEIIKPIKTEELKKAS